jgi:hypothetical protein
MAGLNPGSTGEVQVPPRPRQERVWVPYQPDFFQPFRPLGGLPDPRQPQPNRLFMPGGTIASGWADPYASPFDQAFGVREAQVTRIDTAAGMMGQLSRPQSYTEGTGERVYEPPKTTTASGLAQFGRPDFPLPYNTTGIMWEGSHVSDLAIVDGQITAGGFRAELWRHGFADRERAFTKWLYGKSDGWKATASLNRGTPGAYTNDWLFPYFGDAVAIVRVDGTRVDAQELITMMNERGPQMLGKDYRFSTPPAESRAYQRAFGDLPPGSCAPGAQNCINFPADIHERALGGEHLILETPDGVAIPMKDKDFASASNMKQYVELSDEWFAARGLRKIRIGRTMQLRGMVPTLLGAGTALAGDLIAGGDQHYVRDTALGAAGAGGGAALESRLAPRFVQGLASRGMTAESSQLLGRGAAGAGAAMVAAPVISVVSTYFDDREHYIGDYVAPAARSTVAGGGGALAAGGVGALMGSEVPVLGNIVGFVVGVGGYYLTDWLVGDEIESGIRGAFGENGCKK